MGQKCSQDTILRNNSGLPEVNMTAWVAYASFGVVIAALI